MSAKRVPKAPVLDGVAFEKPLRDAFPTSLGGIRAVYNGQLPRFLQWLRGDGAYEGTGVRDTVNAHAEQLDDHKQNLDEHAAALAALPANDAELQKTLSECRDALEALKSRPF